MKLNRVRWGAALAGALTTEVLMIAAAFAWVAIYSYLLHPGESMDFYQKYATSSSPWVALIAGVPLFFMVCRWIGSRNPSKSLATAMAVFGIYFLIDAPIVLLGDNPEMARWFPAVNYVSKLVACYFGGKSGAGF